MDTSLASILGCPLNRGNLSRGTSRISHRGRSPLRAAAYQQARQLVAHNPDFRARFYALIHRTARRRLAAQEAYVAVMNSYLRIAHSLVTRRELYRPLAERRDIRPT